MRTARIKPIDTNIHGPAGTYYHISNQIAGNSRRWTFGDPEKAQFLERLNELSRFYVIQPLFCSIQGNHYHLVVFVPAQAPAAAEAARRFQNHYAGERKLTKLVARRLPERLRDISRFMHDLQHPFTCWFNRTRPQRRYGELWQGRFKSIILDPRTSLIPQCQHGSP